MSKLPEDGVVDENLAVHGFDDLFVASSATFPTSSQANSTFMLIAFAMRLADQLSSGLKRRDRAANSLRPTALAISSAKNGSPSTR